MTNRKLTRLGLDQLIVSKLNSKQVFTVKDLFSKNEYELVDMLDMSLHEARNLLCGIAEATVVTSFTAWELLQDTEKTQVPQLALAPNIPSLHLPKGITEIVGPAGNGKTQACLTLCAIASRPTELGGLGGPILYIDTESTFSPSRLLEIGQARFPGVFSSQSTLEALSKNVLVYSATTTQKLVQMVEKLEEEVIEKGAQLIIIDSIAAPVRTQFDKAHLPQRQALLVSLAATLKYLSATFNISIIVTNHCTSRLTEDRKSLESAAALGVVWAHAVNTRWSLEIEQDLRSIEISKSPLYSKSNYCYHITHSGFVVNDSDDDSSTLTERKG